MFIKANEIQAKKVAEACSETESYDMDYKSSIESTRKRFPKILYSPEGAKKQKQINKSEKEVDGETYLLPIPPQVPVDTYSNKNDKSKYIIIILK